MLGSRPQLMHNANLAFATSELLFNNLPVLPLHFIFGALFGVQHIARSNARRRRPRPAWRSRGLSQRRITPQAAPSVGRPRPASANQPRGPRWHPCHTGRVSTARACASLVLVGAQELTLTLPLPLIRYVLLSWWWVRRTGIVYYPFLDPTLPDKQAVAFHVALLSVIAAVLQPLAL
jgi:hypothetical protein